MIVCIVLAFERFRFHLLGIMAFWHLSLGLGGQ